MGLNVQCDGFQNKNQLKNFNLGRLVMVGGGGEEGLDLMERPPTRSSQVKFIFSWNNQLYQF